MLNLDDFLAKFKINKDDFSKSGLDHEDLFRIYEDYECTISELKVLSSFVFGCLTDIKRVHSIKKRIKDPKHLIKKIIRRKIEDPEFCVTHENYKDLITDLIGVRVLHLFKDDWKEIHDSIMTKWNMREAPTANIREGDSEALIREFRERGCEIKKHKYGYRSIHYQILLLHNKKEITAEIQVRTLFEEAWSEIDHKIRYPDNNNESILSDYLVIFNRLAGSADEMGTFIRMLKQDLEGKQRELEEKNMIINEILEEINSSVLDQEEKDMISLNLRKLGVFEAVTEGQKTLFVNGVSGQEQEQEQNDYEDQKSEDDNPAEKNDEETRIAGSEMQLWEKKEIKKSPDMEIIEFK